LSKIAEQGRCAHPSTDTVIDEVTAASRRHADPDALRRVLRSLSQKVPDVSKILYSKALSSYGAPVNRGF
jgi:hypothetical protein